MILAGQTLLANADSSVPPLINYQGQLTDASGNPQTGTKKLEFNIYDASSGGNKVWGPQTFNGIPLIGGRFNVMLGSTDAGGNALLSAFGANSRFLGIKVDNGTEITPRQQILSTPFAINAQNSENAINGVPVGTVVSYFSTTAPLGWLLCDGALLPNDQKYDKLRSMVGNNTPDMRSRFIVGTGQGSGLSNHPLTQTGGEETHTLSVNEMPAHSHGIQLGNNTQYGPDNWVQHSDPNGGNWGITNTYNTGGNQPHNIMPPFYALTYIIKI